MRNVLKLRQEIFASIPGLSITEMLFDSFDNVLFCVKERGGRYVAVNMAFVHRVRLTSKEAVLGRTARDFFPPHLASGYEQQDEKVFSFNQEIHDALEMNMNKDGSTGWYLAQKIPLHDHQQKVVALAGISIDLNTRAGDDPALEALAAVIAEIHRDYAKPMRMDDLAKRAGLPISRLERTMQAVLGMSPRQFLTKTRITAAARALRTSKAPLSDIAAGCGFYDQAVFCKHFRKSMALTPGQYRETHSPKKME